MVILSTSPMTYVDFKAFHQRYYHPSNARLLFYGDDDPVERFVWSIPWLRAFDPIAVNSTVNLRNAFPRRSA